MKLITTKSLKKLLDKRIKACLEQVNQNYH